MPETTDGVGAVEDDEAEVVVATDLARPLFRLLRRRSVLLDDEEFSGFEGVEMGFGKGKASCALVTLAL